MPTSFIQLPMIDANVRYYPDFFAHSQADDFFQQLMSDLQWQQDDIKIFGRTVRIPRLQAWYGDQNVKYRYSGRLLQPLPWHPLLWQIKQQCEQQLCVSFNSVLANYYRNGDDSMGMHSDNEPELTKDGVIASATFGAPRDFDFKHINHSQQQPCRYRLCLQHGSLLVMAGQTQTFWQHGLPKRRRCVLPRVNLTFRHVIPDFHQVGNG